VTRKSASLEKARHVAERVTRDAGGIATAIVRLALGELRVLGQSTDEAPSSTVSVVHSGEDRGAAALRAGETDAKRPRSLPAAALEGERVLAISAVGDPGSFERQLAARGARVESHSFADHHRFTSAEAARLASAAAELARGSGHQAPVAVCTLKDAVKLASLWPREAPPLWYVSQQPEVESGRANVDALVVHALAARHRQP
jgi:tetraacyldisaccharide 4'-kinase